MLTTEFYWRTADMPVNLINNGSNLNPIFKQRIDRETHGDWSGKTYHIPLDSVSSDGPTKLLLELKDELDKAKFRALDHKGVDYTQHAATSAAETMEMARKAEPEVASALDQVVAHAKQDLNPEFSDFTVIRDREALGTMDKYSVGFMANLGTENGYNFMPQGLLFVDYTHNEPGFDIVLAKRGEWEV